MQVGQGEPAYRLGAAKVGSKYAGRDKKPIYQNTKITGWPESLAHNCPIAWTFLGRIIESWTWLHDIFGGAAECRAAVTSYYLVLNFLNFIRLSKDGNLEGEELQWPVTVPLMFSRWGAETCDRGYELLLQQRELVQGLREANGLDDEDRFRSLWKTWIEENGRWVGEVNKGCFYRDLGFPHSNLPDDLNRAPNSLEL